VPPTTQALLTRHYPIENVVIQRPRYKNLFIIPSKVDLADAALRLSLGPTRLRALLNGLLQKS
jgi:hypothetical protein